MNYQSMFFSSIEQKNKNKLHLLQAVIHEPPHSPNPGESNTQGNLLFT